MSNAHAINEARHVLGNVEEINDTTITDANPYDRLEVEAGALQRLLVELEQADTLAGRIELLHGEVEDYRNTYHEPGDDPHDTLHEIADGCVPIYHSDTIDVLVSAPWDVLDAMGEAVAEFGPREYDDTLALVRWGLYWLFCQEAHEYWRKLEEEAEEEAEPA